MSRWTIASPLASAAFLAGAIVMGAAPASAQGTLRIGMTASDIPLTTGQTDNGGEGQRFLGFTAYDALVNWDLSSATKPSDLVPGPGDILGGRRRPTRRSGSSSCATA